MSSQNYSLMLRIWNTTETHSKLKNVKNMSIVQRMMDITGKNIEGIMKYHLEMVLGAPDRTFNNGKCLTYFYKNSTTDLDIVYEFDQKVIWIEVSNQKDGRVIYTSISDLIDVLYVAVKFICIECYSAWYYHISDFHKSL